MDVHLLLRQIAAIAQIAGVWAFPCVGQYVSGESSHLLVANGALTPVTPFMDLFVLFKGVDVLESLVAVWE